MRWLVAVLLVSCSKKDPTPAPSPSPPPPASPVEQAPRPTGRGGRPVIAAKLDLVVTVSGQSPQHWDATVFDKAPPLAVRTKANTGNPHNIWSLRELVHERVGPAARVVSVTGTDGTKPLDLADWKDPAKTPIIHSTPRGTFAVRWLGKNEEWGATVASDVSAIEVAPR